MKQKEDTKILIEACSWSNQKVAVYFPRRRLGPVGGFGPAAFRAPYCGSPRRRPSSIRDDLVSLALNIVSFCDLLSSILVIAEKIRLSSQSGHSSPIHNESAVVEVPGHAGLEDRRRL
jgi:hypothetical protein